ncbi:hypothetical protein COTS27_00325 [Spirochaetota bacterium]|nr:hypothetical protein COTS27_00325 [Spirochaetota bacterium]
MNAVKRKTQKPKKKVAVSRKSSRTAAPSSYKKKHVTTSAEKMLLTPTILTALAAAKDRTLFHHFHENNYATLTASEALAIIKQGALALKSLNIKRGDCVGIMMKPSPHWILCEQMIMAIGAVSVGIYDNITFKNLDHYVKETQFKVVFIDEITAFEQLIVFKKKIKTLIMTDALYGNLHRKKLTANFNFLSMSRFLQSGATLHKKYPTRLDKSLTELKKDQLAAIVYTSGSTGVPKGVMLTHENFMAQLTVLQKRYPFTPEQYHALSVLPVAHIFERIIYYLYLSLKVEIYILTDPTKLTEIITKVRPVVMTAVPRLLERVHEAMLTKAKAKPLPLRLLATSAIHHAANREPLAPKTALTRLYDKLVYKKLRQALGNSLKFIVSGGAALDPTTLRFFFGIGIPIYEGYGLTETAPVISCSSEAHFKPYSAGKLLENIKAKISPAGELLIHAPSVMKGYFKQPKQTLKVIHTDKTKKRWFHTGDKVRIEADFIFIEGRLKELFKTSTGKYVNPIHIEKLLAQHKLIDHALVIGEHRKYISALLFINPLNVETYQKKLVEEDIYQFVVTHNENLEHWERIAKFKIVWKTLSISDNELTPKLNIKRNDLEIKFKSLIDALYS